MSLDELRRRVFGKGRTGEDELVHTLYVIMREFHYTLDELKDLPIPTLNLLLIEMNKENKESNKKGGKRSR